VPSFQKRSKGRRGSLTKRAASCAALFRAHTPARAVIVPLMPWKTLDLDTRNTMAEVPAERFWSHSTRGIMFRRVRFGKYNLTEIFAGRIKVTACDFETGCSPQPVSADHPSACLHHSSRFKVPPWNFDFQVAGNIV